MTDHWDGLERREALLLAEELKPKRETVEAPVIMVLVGFAASLLLQAAALWGHGVILQHADREATKAEEFRRQITCYVGRVSQGRQGPEILTDCGFLNLGTGPR